MWFSTHTLSADGRHISSSPCEKHPFLIGFSILIKHVRPVRQRQSGWVGTSLPLIHTDRSASWQVRLNTGHHLLSCCKQKLPCPTTQSALYKKSYLWRLKPSCVCVPSQMNFNSDPAEGVLLALEMLAISPECLFSTLMHRYILASFLWL